MASRLVVTGFASCPYFQKAKQYAQEKANANLTVRIVELSREEFHANRVAQLKALNMAEDAHKTCPFVYYENESLAPIKFVGGYDSLRASL